METGVPSEKILGYSLIAIGVGIILLALFNVYQIFQRQTSAVEIFDFASVSIDLGKALGLPTTPNAVNQELISSDMVNKPLNLFTHIFIVGFFSSIGFKLANIGTLLVRPIKVQLQKTT